MSETEIASLADTYRPLLRGKNVTPQDRMMAGLVTVQHGARTHQTSLVTAGVRALWDGWGKGIRPSAAGYLLARFAVARGQIDHVKGLLGHFSACLHPNAVELAFSVVWESNDPEMHAVAAPHLPLLIADGWLGRALLPLIGLLIVLRRWDEARPQIQKQMPGSAEGSEAPKPHEETLQIWTRLFIDAAATGHAREALDMITPSPLARWLEPLVFALHAYQGEPHRAPQEVAEVGRDVVERIRARAAALQPNTKGAAAAAPAESPSPPAPAPVGSRRTRGKTVTRAPKRAPSGTPKRSTS